MYKLFAVSVFSTKCEATVWLQYAVAAFNTSNSPMGRLRTNCLKNCMFM